METKIEKEVRYLKIYAVVSTLLFAVFLLSAFAVVSKKKFEEIDVERINVVEKDGKLKMVISNKERQHPGTMDGKYYKEREGQRPAGIIFFSEKGDEIGGLVFDGDTGKGQGGSLTFDKFRGDQTIQFTHAEDADGKYFAGLRVNDQTVRSVPSALPAGRILSNQIAKTMLQQGDDGDARGFSAQRAPAQGDGFPTA